MGDEMDKLTNKQSNALEIATIRQNYDHVIQKIENQPSWPFNFKLITSFFSMILVPAGMLAFELISNRDSIIYELDIFTRLFDFIK